MSALTLLDASKGPAPPKWPDNIKLAVLTPAYPLVDVRVHLSLPKFLQQIPPNSFHFADWRYGVGESREALLHTAMSSVPDLTHILFLDSDIIADDGAVFKLFESMTNNPNIDIVGGIYFNSLLSGLAAWKNEIALRVQDLVGRENPLMEVDKVGIGLTLFKVDVFRRMDKENEERPFFYYKLDAKNNSMMSEDFYFFQKALKYGIKPWIDLRVRGAHMKTVMLLPEGTVAGGLPGCPPGQHWDPAQNRCVPDPQPQPAQPIQGICGDPMIDPMHIVTGYNGPRTS